MTTGRKEGRNLVDVDVLGLDHVDGGGDQGELGAGQGEANVAVVGIV